MRVEDEAGAAAARMEKVQAQEAERQAQLEQTQKQEQTIDTAQTQAAERSTQEQAQLVGEVDIEMRAQDPMSGDESGTAALVANAMSGRVPETVDTNAAQDEPAQVSPGQQQDRGEGWQTFAQSAPDMATPAAVVPTSNVRQNPDQLNIGDLMKQMKIDGGKIDA